MTAVFVFCYIQRRLSSSTFCGFVLQKQNSAFQSRHISFFFNKNYCIGGYGFNGLLKQGISWVIGCIRLSSSQRLHFREDTLCFSEYRTIWELIVLFTFSACYIEHLTTQHQITSLLERRTVGASILPNPSFLLCSVLSLSFGGQ